MVKKQKDRRKSIAKGLETRAKNLRAEAKALRERAIGDMSLAGDRLRRQAKELTEQAKKRTEKAKDIKREIRAEKNKITVGEQRILDQQQTLRARQTREANARARREAEQIPNFDTAYIDTVKELCLHGRGGAILNTPVALAIRHTIDRMINTYGEQLTAFVCEKALNSHHYIFDSYIYQSDQGGVLTNETLMVLQDYAQRYIEDYQGETFDETELGLDEDDGTGEIYY